MPKQFTKQKKVPTTPSTQDFIDVEEIVNDIVVLKDGSACTIIEVAAINFGLFSEREQEATIYAYAQLLNSLTFSIQIILVSKRKDISDYLNLIESRLNQTTSAPVKNQIIKYRDFIKSIVRQGNVLDKKFYMIIPFSSLELGLSNTISSLRPNRKLTLPIADIVERASTNLIPKRDHLIRLLARIGLRARELSSPELLQLFFDLHNRDHLGTRVDLPLTEFTAAPIIQAPNLSDSTTHASEVNSQPSTNVK